MLKVSFFSGESELGPTVVPLFTSADAVFEKTASASLLPEVVRYIDTLRPRQDAQYVLVNAMGAGEYFGSNVNGDYFSEASLIHRPDEWTGNPLLDKIRSKDWAYGYPTFYFAHPYAHHRNKDASRAFGEVELAAWNDRMKRVELVTRVDKDKCAQYGGQGVWDKLSAGQFPDVSMGCKVPYDTCSICLDWKRYRDAQGTFDPKKHKSPGEAVLAVHKKTPIRGVSITRADYCDHAKKSMNKILPDGRKVFVYNDYPKFFDISFVFIGADKTAKTMMKIASESSGQSAFWDMGPSAEMAEKLGYAEGQPLQKTAEAIEDEVFDLAFGKRAAVKKKSEIIKDIVPSQFAGKAVPALTAVEPDLPRDLLDVLSKAPLESSLSTSGALGIVLRPREFQRVVLVHLGHGGLANELDSSGTIFPEVEDRAPMQLGPEDFMSSIARLLLPFLAARSAIAPAIEKRVIMIGTTDSKKEKKASSSLPTNLLRKIGAAYNAYRGQLMDLAAHAQNLIEDSAYPFQADLRKLSSASPEALFSPLSVAYIKTAFMDEVGARHESGHKLADSGNVERGIPSRTT